MPNNAHKLLYHPSHDCLLRRLDLLDRQEKRLKSARDDIRRCIRAALRNWTDYIDDAGGLFTDQAKDPADTQLIVRFRMQGSLQYGTANRPAHLPPQEVDLDDGMFIPAPLIQAAGEQRPVLLVGGLFTVVEAALSGLCEDRGWTLQEKPTCVRIKLSKEDHSHVDLPIYAVPKARYQEIEEGLAKALTQAKKNDFVDRQDDVQLLEEAYRSLSADEIMLAHREDGWVRSDPRRIEDWFDAARGRHGRQLLRICRLIKAWRDYQFERGGPSSIALMCCVVQVYDRCGQTMDASRDDLALLQLARELPAILAGSVNHPVPDCPALDDGWTAELRSSFINAARALNESLERAIHKAVSPDKVIEEFEAQFGDRFPANAFDLVEIDDALAASLSTLLEELGERPRPLPKTRKSTGERRYA